MTNYLKMPKKQQVTALLALGWSYRRIEAETGVHRETVAGSDPKRAPTRDLEHRTGRGFPQRPRPSSFTVGGEERRRLNQRN